MLRMTSTVRMAVNIAKLTQIINRESPAQFENRIKPRVYVSRITRSTMYEKASLALVKLVL